MYIDCDEVLFVRYNLKDSPCAVFVTFNNLYKIKGKPPLWSSSQSSWLQIQRSGFDSRVYQISSEK
jgi:hypothetical protein